MSLWTNFCLKLFLSQNHDSKLGKSCPPGFAIRTKNMQFQANMKPVSTFQVFTLNFASRYKNCKSRLKGQQLSVENI